MPDLHVVATIPAKPESLDEVRAALVRLADATRSEEGCVDYVLYESAAAPGTFVTVERWRSQADLDQHLASAHVAAAMETAQDRLSGEITIHPLSAVGAG